jgi:hypothetical protein
MNACVRGSARGWNCQAMESSQACARYPSINLSRVTIPIKHPHLCMDGCQVPSAACQQHNPSIASCSRKPTYTDAGWTYDIYGRLLLQSLNAWTCPMSPVTDYWYSHGVAAVAGDVNQKIYLMSGSWKDSAEDHRRPKRREIERWKTRVISNWSSCLTPTAAHCALVPTLKSESPAGDLSPAGDASRRQFGRSLDMCHQSSVWIREATGHAWEHAGANMATRVHVCELMSAETGGTYARVAEGGQVELFHFTARSATVHRLVSATSNR